jgi:hypothetical protein
MDYQCYNADLLVLADRHPLLRLCRQNWLGISLRLWLRLLSYALINLDQRTLSWLDLLIFKVCIYKVSLMSNRRNNITFLR